MANDAGVSGCTPQFLNLRLSRQNTNDTSGSWEEGTGLVNTIREFGDKLKRYKEFCEYVIQKVPKGKRAAIQQQFGKLENAEGKN